MAISYIRSSVEPNAVARELSPESDINYQTFQQMKADENWFNKHLGYYVAFVDGKLVGEDKDRSRLLVQIRSEFPKKPKFFTQVELEEKTVDIPTPVTISDI